MEQCRRSIYKSQPPSLDAHGHFIYTRSKMHKLAMLPIMILLICSECIIRTTSAATDLGWTSPAGTIIQPKGSEIRIICGVNGGDLSSNNLAFYINSKRVDDKYVRNLNTTAIELLIPDAEEQESNIVCKHNTSGVSYNDIKIGRWPDEIEGLKCVSPNWYDMNCSFTIPKNYVPVHYTMKYRVVTSQQVHLCNQPKIKTPGYFWCHVDHHDYRRGNQKFEFFLESTNLLGTKEQRIIIDNFASVVPDEVIGFQAAHVMSDKVELRWAANTHVSGYPNPFEFEILISTEKECDNKPKRLKYFEDEFVDVPQPRNFSYTLNLNFSHTWYDISIRTKVKTAPDSSEMWSKWSKIQKQTAMRRPDNPPKIDVGSFNIGPGGDVFIYWEHVKKCFQNGNEFSYLVKSSEKQHENPDEILPNVVIYSKDHVRLDKDTTYTIRSSNSKGLSEEASTLVIPGKLRLLNGPTKIKKRVFNDSYVISWSPPNGNQEEITSYTVFWCATKVEQPNKCEGSINFEHRKPSEESYRYESSPSESVNFAVSANSKTSSSGMIWARCTTAQSNEIGKIKTIWIPRLTSSQIEVEWKLECFDSGIVAGYQLEYCPSREPKTLECMEPEKKLNITGKLENPKHTLTNLMPYTTYKIVIRMFSNSTMGPASDPLANTTLEAAPSEVRGLIARNIGNTSVELYWDPPEFSNGVLLFYKVWANGKDHKVNELDHTVEIDHTIASRMNYTLKDLMAFTEYDIVVEACTKECSKPSKTKIKTTIGAPGNFSRQPTIEIYPKSLMKNITSASIKWEEPTFKGGELDYYEFRTKISKTDGTIEDRIIKARNKQCFIDQLCSDEVMLYEFSVRGVNFVLTPHSKETQTKIVGMDDRQNCDRDDAVLMNSLKALKQVDPHGWHLEGPWSPAIGHSCHFGGADSKQFAVIVLSTVFSLIIAVFVILSYNKIKEMKDIIVQMPPGLEDLTGDKSKKGKDLGNMDKMGTPDILRNVDNTSINCEDENGQLLKKSLNGSLNGADCSSSMHSGSTRSDIDNIEHEDEIEYGQFRNDQNKQSTDRLEGFMINSLSGKDTPSNLTPPVPLPRSTPIADKFPKPSVAHKMPILSNGYVSQPTPKVISPMSPISNSGYVTHSMFQPIQSSGYTSCNVFNKPNPGLEHKINSKMPIVATTDQEGISGYVTHKQLSDFGHRMQ